MLGIAGRGFTLVALTRITTSSFKDWSTPRLSGSATRHLQSYICPMCHLRPHPVQWLGVFGTPEDGLFRNSSPRKLSSFIRIIGRYILTTTLQTTKNRPESCGS